MITLELADLVVIASRTLSLGTGDVLNLLDTAAAQRALAQAAPGGGSGDPAAQAAALLHALVRQRPLRRGNQQVALAAMLQLLALNGWEADLEPPGQAAAVVTGIAAGTLGPRDLADWLAPRLRPGAGASHMEEAPMPERPAQPAAEARPLAERLKRATMRTQPKGMFGRFTDRARRAVHLAHEEARLLRHDHIGTEHLLLGLLYEAEGTAARALASLGISREDVRGQVEEIIGRGHSSPVGTIPFTAPAKKALELSLREALALGHHSIGTGHLVLGLLREGDDVAAQALGRLGTGPALARERVLDLLAEESEQADPQARLADDLCGTAEQLTQVRRGKEAAFDAGDLAAAAALRDQERQLLAGKLRLEQQLSAGLGGQAIIAENQRLHREVGRLRGLLRQHGIEPDGGTAQSA